MREWWLANWRLLLGSGGFTAIIIPLLVALVSRHKRQERQIQPASPAPDFSSQVQPENSNLSYNQGKVFSEHLAYKKAVKCFKRAVTEYAPDSLDCADALAYAGIMYWYLSRYKKAIECYLEAQAIYYGRLQENQEELTRLYNNLAIAYYSQGNYEKALVWYFKALKISEEILGKDHLDTADTYGNIARVYSDQRKYELALEYFYKELQIEEKTLGKDHSTMANTYECIAIDYGNQRKYNEALLFYLKAYNILRKEELSGVAHTDTKRCLSNLRTDYKRSKRKEPFDDWLAAQLKD